jgi:hypothetical protein
MAHSKEHLVDKRIIDRNIAKGLISRKDYESHLEGLKDASENAAAVEVSEEEGEDEAGES